VLAIVVAVVAIGSDSADARRRKKYRIVGYKPPYSAIVVDANSGEILHAANADALRHPASLTKVMTLYLLFEQLEAGKLKLDSEMRVSAYAAAQAPSKLGVRAGQTIDVEDAIKALVTKSANDVSVVIAEAIAGDEDDFAALMTRKARALGMSRTIYKNANGLPNPQQVTTARDQAILGRAIQDRFPRYYRYFATARFHYRGRVIANHNRLLGRVPGVDGIKTGYVRASGFNLISSMRRDGRHIVGVVLGGSSGGVRDARMRSLLEGNIREASVRRTAPKITEVAEASAPRAARTRVASVEPAAKIDPVPMPVARQMPTGKPLPIHTFAASAPTPAPAAAPAPGSAEPIKPIPVKTMAVRRGPLLTGAIAAATGATRTDTVYGLASEEATRPVALSPAAAPAPAKTLDRQAALIEAQPAAATASTPPLRTASRAPVRGEWVIQIGAFPAETQANDRLKAAQSTASAALARAEPFTERITKGDTTLFRARFAGFDKSRAEAACKALKRSDIACLALKN
jgi:D-alanyl-D-alanine carboxypeptidase